MWVCSFFKSVLFLLCGMLMMCEVKFLFMNRILWLFFGWVMIIGCFIGGILLICCCVSG